jgi:serine/threonine protein kinase
MLHTSVIKRQERPSDTTGDMTGITIGSYEMGEKIGSGGVADVYRAIDPLLGRTVAIKLLRAGLGDRAEVVSRFHTEARTLAQLVHPNIALLYCLLREGSHLGMVMEYVEGRTFAQILRSSGRLAPERALPLVYQALDGIGHAHQAGVVHRDIKASNLMLASNGCVKVMDFGIARCLISAERATRQGYMVGTMQYMSPEQVRGKETDPRSDVYSLGVLLYELLTGELPFDSENDYELCRLQIETPPRPPRAIAKELPDALESVVLRALAKDPDARFPDVLELREALQHASSFPAPPRVSADRDAPITRELALEDAEQIAQASTRSFTGTGSRRALPAPPTLVDARVAGAEPQAGPTTRLLPRSRGRVAAAVCALAALVILCGVQLVRYQARAPAEPAPQALVEKPEPVVPAAANPAPAAPAVAEPAPVKPAPARTAKRKPMAAETERPLPSQPVASEPAAAKRGESGWVIRRR